MRSLTGLPLVTVEADGGALSEDELRLLSSIRVQHILSLPTQCELTFSGHAGRSPSGSLFSIGTSLQVRVGEEAQSLFGGEVTAVEHTYDADGNHVLRVRAYDLLHRLRKTQAVKAHVQLTLRELADELAGGAGLSVAADDDGPLYDLIVQHRQSDFDLLADRCARSGYYMRVEDSDLHLITLDGSGDEIDLKLGDTLLEARFDVNSDRAVRDVGTAGWSPRSVEVRSGDASSPRVGRMVGAEASPGDAGGSTERRLVGEIVQTDDQAVALAQAELDARSGGEVTMEASVDGDPRLRAGTPVNVFGVESDLEGRYVIARATHTVDGEKGFVTELSTAPPTKPSRPHGAEMVYGEVSDVDDPDARGRIRVTLPTFDDVVSEWMPVLIPGAGESKGFIALPDVGDRVLVLHAQDEPGEGVVLGGLYGPTTPPDSGVTDGEVVRYTLLTRGGSRLLLDDGNDIVRIEDPTGNFVEMSPEKFRLKSAVDLEIDASGKSVTITGKKIDFRRAT